MQQTILERVDPIADGVLALMLRGAAGSLAPWEPGAHVDVDLPNWLTRQYSLCGDPADRDSYRIAVRRERLSRGGSDYIHQFLNPGRTLQISTPRNNFPLAEAPSYLFVAGGIGITPILPMLATAVAGGVPARLVHAGRTRASMPFADELQAGYRDRVRIVASDEHGVPDLAALAAALDPSTHVYCCGPAPMLAAAEAAFPAERLHVERFRPAPRTFAPNTAFEVVCARSGQVVPVGAEQSMLDALTHAGLPVGSGCREGVCGSCELVVLDGVPEHRDDVGAADGRMYCCVSRARTPRLVVDL